MTTIKKTILLALAVLVMAGCEERSSKSVYGVDVVTIDSCKYIRSVLMGYCVYSHNANCCFCEERDSIKWEKHKKELEELIIKLKEK